MVLLVFTDVFIGMVVLGSFKCSESAATGNTAGVVLYIFNILIAMVAFVLADGKHKHKQTGDKK